MLAALLFFGLCESGATAADVGADRTWFFQAGDGDRAVKSATVGVSRQFNPFDLFDASGRWSLYGEATVGEWFPHDRSGNARTNFTQAGVAPILRYRLMSNVFLEAGIGADVITPRFHDGDKRFGSKFNFDDHLAVGTRFGVLAEHEVSFRAEHFSNGGIRKPNPGQNFLALRYARHF